jgi:peptidoglycan/LPS O-acetylase OafA/YrhL
MSLIPAKNRHVDNPYYRSDIDGLRGIAVLLVLGFHAFPRRIQGGFFGVDVFFVISGFLISSIIFGGLENKRFSFAQFYARRIRRIFPALFLVLFATFAFGFFILLPDRFEQLGRHVLAGTGFISNFVFWSEAGYFDNASTTKPLMHLWSLGIEEQFYIVWPLFLYLTYKLRWNLLFVTLIIFVASLTWNIYTAESDAVAAFYSPLARFWELMTGGLLAYMTLHEPVPVITLKRYIGTVAGKMLLGWPAARVSTVWHNAKAGCGILLIAAASLFVNQDTHFLGWWTLTPVFGCFLVLSAGNRAWLNSTLLSSRFLVWVGLVSYPLYLWHWPVLSFAHIIEGGTPGREVRIAASLVCVALAWITYEFAERPIRFGKNRQVKTVALCVLMTAMACIGFNTKRVSALMCNSAYETDKKNLAQLKWDEIKPDCGCLKLVGLEEEVKRKQGVFCLLKDSVNTLGVAIIGDCTGNDLYPGFEKVFKEKNVCVINIGNGTCLPFRGIHGKFDYNRDCEDVNSKIYDFLLKNARIKIVVLSFAAWDIQNMGFDGIPDNASLAAKFSAMSKLVDKDIIALKNAGKTVVITFDSPLLRRDPRKLITVHALSRNRRIPENDFEARQPYLSMWADMLSTRQDVCVFYKFPNIQTRGYFGIVDSSGVLLYRDNHHLSYVGSEYVAREFINCPCVNKTKR